MRNDDVNKYLFDIASACELLVQFTAKRTFEQYAADPLLRSAVERQLEIAGEALQQALKCDPELAELITDARRIVAFRNRLVHGYADVSHEIAWGIIVGNLPSLREEIAKLIQK